MHVTIYERSQHLLRKVKVSGTLLFNEAHTRHLLGLLQSHDVEDGRSHVCQDAALHLRALVLCYIDERWSAVIIVS